MLTRNLFRQLIRVCYRCRFYSLTGVRPKEIRFSESGAYHGLDKKTRAFDLNDPLYIPNKYDSIPFRTRRMVYAVVSVFVLLGYFAFWREPSDLDIILNAPPHLLTESIQRNMLRNQINQARATGQSTELLEAELAYIDVRKEAMKAKNAAQSKA